MKTLQKAIALSRAKGFTLIELLIVIAVLGVLAVAVLSAINPIEQINRGRDTGARSDAEQLISAVDRYYASKQTYPWNGSGLADDDPTGLVSVNRGDWTVSGGAQAGTDVLDLLADTGGGTGELKSAFVDRVDKFIGDRQLQVYNQGISGSSTYVCFIPQSGSFHKEALDRCTGGLPTDIVGGAATTICAAGLEMVCLP